MTGPGRTRRWAVATATPQSIGDEPEFALVSLATTLTTTTLPVFAAWWVNGAYRQPHLASVEAIASSAGRPTLVVEPLETNANTSNLPSASSTSPASELTSGTCSVPVF